MRVLSGSDNRQHQTADSRQQAAAGRQGRTGRAGQTEQTDQTDQCRQYRQCRQCIIIKEI